MEDKRSENLSAEPLTFEYEVFGKFAIRLLASLMIVMGVWLLLETYNRFGLESVMKMTFGIVSGIFFTLLGSWLVMLQASITISSEGISARVLGITSRKMRWVDIRRVTQQRTVYYGQSIEQIGIYGRKLNIIEIFFVNILGNIVFNSQIENYDDLISLLKFRLSEFEIPFFVLYQK